MDDKKVVKGVSFEFETIHLYPFHLAIIEFSEINENISTVKTNIISKNHPKRQFSSKNYGQKLY